MGVLGFALWLGCFASEERGPVVADAPFPEVPVDADGDGVEAPADCDDADAGVLPGMVEACDGVDEDCDGTVDDACVRARDALRWQAASPAWLAEDGACAAAWEGEGACSGRTLSVGPMSVATWYAQRGRDAAPSGAWRALALPTPADEWVVDVLLTLDSATPQTAPGDGTSFGWIGLILRDEPAASAIQLFPDRAVRSSFRGPYGPGAGRVPVRVGVPTRVVMAHRRGELALWQDGVFLGRMPVPFVDPRTPEALTADPPLSRVALGCVNCVATVSEAQVWVAAGAEAPTGCANRLPPLSGPSGRMPDGWGLLPSEVLPDAASVYSALDAAVLDEEGLLLRVTDPRANVVTPFPLPPPRCPTCQADSCGDAATLWLDVEPLDGAAQIEVAVRGRGDVPVLDVACQATGERVTLDAGARWTRDVDTRGWLSFPVAGLPSSAGAYPLALGALDLAATRGALRVRQAWLGPSTAEPPDEVCVGAQWRVRDAEAPADVAAASRVPILPGGAEQGRSASMTFADGVDSGGRVAVRIDASGLGIEVSLPGASAGERLDLLWTLGEVEHRVLVLGESGEDVTSACDAAGCVARWGLGSVDPGAASLADARVQVRWWGHSGVATLAPDVLEEGPHAGLGLAWAGALPWAVGSAPAWRVAPRDEEAVALYALVDDANVPWSALASAGALPSLINPYAAGLERLVAEAPADMRRIDLQTFELRRCWRDDAWREVYLQTARHADAATAVAGTSLTWTLVDEPDGAMLATCAADLTDTVAMADVRPTMADALAAQGCGPRGGGSVCSALQARLACGEAIPALLEELARDLHALAPDVSLVVNLTPDGAARWGEAFRGELDAWSVTNNHVGAWAPRDWSGVRVSVMNDVAPSRVAYVLASGPTAELSWHRAPTPTELRAMAWLQILDGASALRLFGWPAADRALHAAVEDLGRELRALWGVVPSRRLEPDPASAPSSVRAGAWQADGSVELVVVNTGERAVAARVVVGEVSLESVDPGPPAAIFEGVLSVALEGFEARRFRLRDDP